eukprot:3245571-Rhodomonas_salina.2
MVPNSTLAFEKSFWDQNARGEWQKTLWNQRRKAAGCDTCTAKRSTRVGRSPPQHGACSSRQPGRRVLPRPGSTLWHVSAGIGGSGDGVGGSGTWRVQNSEAVCSKMGASLWRPL